jgi:hypothetical protein
MIAAQPPTQSTSAAILWIVYSSVAVAGNLLVGPGILALVVGELVAIAFLATGIRTLSGSPHSVFVGGILSIVWGALILITFLIGVAVADETAIRVVLVVLGLLVSGTLITAGILACVGDAKFKPWRQYLGR